MLAAIYTSTSLRWADIEEMPRAELIGLIDRIGTAEMEVVRG